MVHQVVLMRRFDENPDSVFFINVFFKTPFSTFNQNIDSSSQTTTILIHHIDEMTPAVNVDNARFHEERLKKRIMSRSTIITGNFKSTSSNEITFYPYSVRFQHARPVHKQYDPFSSSFFFKRHNQQEYALSTPSSSSFNRHFTSAIPSAQQRQPRCAPVQVKSIATPKQSISRASVQTGQQRPCAIFAHAVQTNPKLLQPSASLSKPLRNGENLAENLTIIFRPFLSTTVLFIHL